MRASKWLGPWPDRAEGKQVAACTPKGGKLDHARASQNPSEYPAACLDGAVALHRPTARMFALKVSNEAVHLAGESPLPCAYTIAVISIAKHVAAVFITGPSMAMLLKSDALNSAMAQDGGLVRGPWWTKDAWSGSGKLLTGQGERWIESLRARQTNHVRSEDFDDTLAD